MANVSILATVADLSASQVAGSASALIPTGTVLPFAGSAAPSGWLLCNGQEISQTTYAQLFSVLSTTYNTQINPTTGSAWATPTAGNFRVPDYRGSFLRGVGTASGKDATTLGGWQGEKTKTPATAFTTAGTSISALSLNSSSTSGTSGPTNVDHTHTLSGNFLTPGGSGAYTSGTFSITSNVNPTTNASNSNLNHTHSLGGTAAAQTLSSGSVSASTVNGGGDNETRPVNKGVNYIIKI